MPNANMPYASRHMPRCYSLHVPGLARPADLPSRVPFIADPAGNLTGAAGVETVWKLATCHWHMVAPTAGQLHDISSWLALLAPSDEQFARICSFLGTPAEW
jgi:hypothetical protein